MIKITNNSLRSIVEKHVLKNLSLLIKKVEKMSLSTEIVEF
jgi:hypothetical protein